MTNRTLTATQDPTASLDYTIDWTEQLAANGTATIASCTVTCATAGTTITGKTNTATTVTWRFAAAGVTPAVWVDCVVHVVLSTGEQDERTLRVQITDR